MLNKALLGAINNTILNYLSKHTKPKYDRSSLFNKTTIIRLHTDR